MHEADHTHPRGGSQRRTIESFLEFLSEEDVDVEIRGETFDISDEECRHSLIERWQKWHYRTT